jgi:RecJ-like exonuclease
MMGLADKKVPKQALNELQSILEKPYKDVCNVCKGVGKITCYQHLPQVQGVWAATS